MNKEIVLATNNRHKLKEFREILSPLGYIVYCPDDLNTHIDVDETGSTYFENSYLKAKAVSEKVPFPVIADDSGFEVINIDRFPGLYSSRFAEQFDNDYIKAGAELNTMLGDKNRDAEFHCVICLLEKKSAKPLYFEGICAGKLLKEPKGLGGFGYDPYFYSDELQANMGEVTNDEKNKVSHRSKALKKLITYLKIK